MVVMRCDLKCRVGNREKPAYPARNRPNTGYNMTDRKDAIKTAAQAIFLSSGYAAATIAQIGRDSASTVGSIYHAFKGKAAIARALLLDARSTWTIEAQGITGKDKPRKAITAMIQSFLFWGRDNPDLFRLHEELSARAVNDPDFADFAQDLSDESAAGEAIYAKWASKGTVKYLPWPLASAIIYGPAREFLSAGGVPDDETVEVLSHAAWQAVKGDAAQKKKSKP